MSTFIAPSFGPNAAGPSASSTASGSRGRNTEEADGRSFNAVLTRSRGADASQAKEDSASPALDAKARQKPSRTGDRKDDLPAELLPLAFFTPTLAALAGTPATGTALAAGAAAAASMTDGARGLLPDDAAAVAALPADAADAVPGETPAATELAGEASASAAVTRDAQVVASGTAQPKNKGGAEASIAQAASPVPLPAAAGAGTGTSAGTVAAPAADAAPSNDATAVAATSIAGESAAASVSSQSADEAKTAPTAAMIAADKLDLGAASDNAPAPSAVPASMPFATAAADRMNAPAGPVPVLTVAPPVGSDEWGQAVGHQMLRMNAAGAQVAELNLNPAGLGPLKVTLSIGDNQAQAMFVSAHESVRKAVEAALPQLRASLAEQGISLGQTSVGAEAHRFAGQDGAFGQQAQQQGSARQPEYPAPGRAEAAAAADPLHGNPPPAAPRTSRAGVDTFA